MRPDEYEYFEYDNALFRKRADSGLSAVDDVWFPTGWTPYKGDRQEKYMFGDRIDPACLPSAARTSSAKIEDITGPKGDRGHPNLVKPTKQKEGRAFQILGVSIVEKPKPR